MLVCSFQQENIFMKRNAQRTATTTANADAIRSAGSNGKTLQSAEAMIADLSVILAGLQTMRDGDFSVRLPGAWTGLAGKIADTFNEIVDRKSTRLNSSHVAISYAVFCLKKKKAHER